MVILEAAQTTNAVDYYTAWLQQGFYAQGLQIWQQAKRIRKDNCKCAVCRVEYDNG